MAIDDHQQPTIDTKETTRNLDSSPAVTFSIPGFRLQQKLGEGGMGEVFEAEQLEPVRRKVALKLIKKGMESKEVLARFDSERQALALMSHPNIAQVYDAGTTSEGRPFFVMEFVQGVPLTEYCDRNRLSTRERLELFVQICDGVQHAHHKGVIHRDLKPSNVLVKIQDTKPVPKIIDFGVAKAVAQRLTEQTLFTAVGEFIGTPEYMSPEQADMTGLDIDTRTDVYSLGVILYELLVGARPFDARELRRAGFDEMRRRIREEDPPKPSVRLSSLGELSTETAANRSSEPPTLVRQVRGDLDWITMKALEKDRTRRYSSPGELAADLHRHLRSEPVLAGPPSTTYRFKKFVRRHTIGVAASALVILALILGVAGTTIGMIRARNAERAASREAETARQVSDFLIRLFEVSDPSEGSGAAVTAREMLDKGAERIRADLNDQPMVQARLMSTMGWVYISLGLYDTAQEILEEALAIRESRLPPDHPDVGASLNELGEAHREKAEYDQARPLYERALAIREKEFGPKSPQVAAVLNNLGLLHVATGNYDEALAMYQRALDIDRQAVDSDDVDLAETLANLAILHVRMGHLDEAKSLFERALRIHEAAYGGDHILVARSLNSMAGVLNDIGEYQAALPLYERSLAIKEKVLGPDHPSVASTLSNLGTLLRTMGRPEAARPALERSVAVYRKALGPDHPDVAEPLTTLAIVYATTGQPDAARPLFEEALEIRERTLSPDHPDVATSLMNLGVFMRSTGDDGAARPYYERALRACESALGPDHPTVALALTNLANLLKDLGEFETARALYDRALLIREAAFGPDHPDVAYTVLGLASLEDQLGNLESARSDVARALQIQEHAFGPVHPWLAATWDDYSDLSRRLGDTAEAEHGAARASEIREQLDAMSAPN
jgi:non-specific serine/threonine protein kinase/serine/threonine-protein kinase